jgi:dihydroorotate dehydrogenase electron transfer subunit
MSRPVQELGTIMGAEPVGEYVQFTVRAPRIASRFSPGQFVTLGVGGPHSALLLRRAFALSGASPDAVQFVVAEHGPGTQWLVRQPVGTRVDLVGPLGTPFPLPSKATAVVLVGGGYGTAPLLPLAGMLADIGCEVESIIGAASSQRLFGAQQAATHGAVTITTDDGSAGVPGRVTDVLPAAIKRIDAERIYACGPMAMLQAVADLACDHKLCAYVSVEEAMACGIGTCMTCVLPVCGPDGALQLVRTCVDGPVFPADRVRWDAVGWLPDDLLGVEAMRTRP